MAYREKNGSKDFSKKDTFIESYGNSLKLSKSIAYDFTYNGDELSLIETSDGGDHINMFFQHINIEERTIHVFVGQLVKNTLEFSKEITKIAERPLPFNVNPEEKDYFNIKASPDGRLIASVPSVFSPTASTEFITVYDVNFRPVWKMKFSMSEIRQVATPEEYFLDNMGNIHLYYSKKPINNIGENEDSIESYFLVTFNERVINHREIKIEELSITNLKIVSSEGNNFVLTGFCSKPKFGSNGTFFERVSINEKGDILINPNIFDFNFITKFTSEGRLKQIERRAPDSSPKDLQELNFDSVILDNNNNLYQIAEQHYVDTVFVSAHANGVPGVQDVKLYEVYKSIIVVKYDVEGNLVWKKKIPKYQRFLPNTDYHLSYTVNYVDEKMVFVFNDLSAHLTHFKAGMSGLLHFTKMRTEGALFSVVLSPEGEVTKKRLLKYDKSTPYACPNNKLNQEGNKIILPMKNGKKLQFVKLEIN
ncbi:MAG: hypothetical protein P8H59_04280 [Flavobacteriales bacterium]|nr:hypothetical protein [Flavobacteriales bacterium]